MTSTPPPLPSLGNVPWLRDADPKALAALANSCTLLRLGRGESVPGMLQPTAALVLSGQLESEVRRNVVRFGVGALICPEALWVNAPDFPTTRAVSNASLALLEQARFEQLSATHPTLALLLLRVALGSDGRSLQATHEEHLLVMLPDGQRSVPLGTPLSALLPSQVDGLPVVAALVDRRATALCATLVTNSHVAPLTPKHWEGQRIQRRSFALLTLEAARQLEPNLPIKMGPSVGFGQRILVPTLKGQALLNFTPRLEAKMRQLIEQDLALHQRLWPYDEANRLFEAEGWPDAARLLETWRDTAVPLVGYGQVRAIEMGPLLPSTGMFGGFHVLADDDFLLLVYGSRSHSPARPTRSMPALALSDVGETPADTPGHATRGFLLQEARSATGLEHQVTFEEQAWLRALGVSSVGTFNHACVRGNVPDLIRVSEGFQEKRLSLIADEILRRAAEVRIVCIAGPSSSGKTTFIRRLCVQLKVNGISPVALGLDDYYVDRERSPRDATGDLDFEALEALQLDLLHDHVERLLRGQPVVTPRYDFKLGLSHLTGGHPLQLGERDVLLVEGIHGLNPLLLGDVPAPNVFRIFVCPLMQLSFDHASRVHASDVRLIRRIVRDRHNRGHDAAQTIARWPKVRAGERRYIYPHQSHADAVFDSSLVYELSVLRVYAERYLLECPRDHDSYTTAFRLMQLLDRFVSIYPEHVPRTSILREFIGGSSFDD